MWDGHETTAEYAARVHLPATKSLDLGGGVALELVLIPAGQFIMGSEAPKKPSVTENEAVWLFVCGGTATVLLFLMLILQSTQKGRLSFPLRWLLFLTVAIGAFTGGLIRQALADKEYRQYQHEIYDYERLPSNEKPAHLVTLTQPFYMGKYTVTQEQYEAILGSHQNDYTGAQLPVVAVTWDNATEFCSKLNELLNDKTLAVRLPTEAQWEYACHAGTRTRFYAGDAKIDLDAAGWYEKNSGIKPNPVGQKKMNAFGLYDMHGNVWEWCQDFYAENYTSVSTTDPLNDKGTSRVGRGGCFHTSAETCSTSFRRGYSQTTCGSNLGFRVIASPPPPF